MGESSLIPLHMLTSPQLSRRYRWSWPLNASNGYSRKLRRTPSPSMWLTIVAHLIMDTRMTMQ